MLAPGNFSTTSSRPVPPPTTASPISGWWPSTTCVTSPSRLGVPPRPVPSTGTAASLWGVTAGRMWRIESRWLAVSMKPPVPGVEASRNESGDTSCALPAVRMTWSSDTCSRASRRGSTSTWSCRSRAPKMETLATPSMPSRRGRIVQRASTDASIGDMPFGSRPIIITRLCDDSGCSICGGCDTFGFACACVSCSWTSCRASKRLVRGSKSSTIEDSPGTDSERSTVTPFVPFSRSASSGTVTSCSTSSAERPSASVWTSTYGGVNSGRTSTGASRSCRMPTARMPAATATTSSRNRTLDTMIPRIAYPCARLRPQTRVLVRREPMRTSSPSFDPTPRDTGPAA